MVLADHQVRFDGAKGPLQQIGAVDGVGDRLARRRPGHLRRRHVELEIEDPE